MRARCRARRFITCFVTVFATVIAITKDLADVEGDKRFGIQTFATRLGVRNIAFLGAAAAASASGPCAALPCARLDMGSWTGLVWHLRRGWHVPHVLTLDGAWLCMCGERATLLSHTKPAPVCPAEEECGSRWLDS